MFFCVAVEEHGLVAANALGEVVVGAGDDGLFEAGFSRIPGDAGHDRIIGLNAYHRPDRDTEGAHGICGEAELPLQQGVVVRAGFRDPHWGDCPVECDGHVGRPVFAKERDQAVKKVLPPVQTRDHPVHSRGGRHRNTGRSRTDRRRGKVWTSSTRPWTGSCLGSYE